MSRTRVARGVYRDQFGFEVRWREQGRTRSKRFPLDAPLQNLTAYRDTKVRLSTQRTERERGGSFPRDAVRWLAGRKRLASFKSDRAHLRPWIHRFKKLSRYAITTEAVQSAIEEWRFAGYAPRELRHRRRILSQCLASLNGADASNPCDGVKLPKIVKSRPRSVSDTLVRDVALELRKHEILGQLRTAKTRARYLVDATCGQRPVQHMRAKPADLDLERRIWFVEPAKGDNGTIVYLNDDMLAAWALFIAARAWGRYDRRSHAKVLRRCGWPVGIRPYNLRHTVGLTMSELGVDLGDIQAHMGHSSPLTTRMYTPGVLARLKDASERIDGRLTGGFSTELPPKSATTSRKQKANARQNTPQFAGEAVREKGPRLRAKNAKYA